MPLVWVHSSFMSWLRRKKNVNTYCKTASTKYIYTLCSVCLMTEAYWKQQRSTIKTSTPLSSYMWRTRDRPLSLFPLQTQDSRSSLFQVAKSCHAITSLCMPLSFLLCRCTYKTLPMQMFMEKKIEKTFVLSWLKVGLFLNVLFMEYLPTLLWAPTFRQSSVPSTLNYIYPSEHF